MDDYLILDLLFGLIVLLFAAIGVWRGLVKELCVTAAVFIGAALATEWAASWGEDLAESFDLRTNVAQMIVASVALIGPVLLLGYLGGSRLPRTETGWGSRVVGGLLAGVNGGLLVHFALENVQRFFTGDSAQEALDESYVARFLLSEFGWALIGVCAIALVVVVIGLFRRRGADFVYQPDSISAASGVEESSGWGRPARLPRSADTGKFEPQAAGFDGRTGRYAADAPSVQQTMAFPPVDPQHVTRNGGHIAPAVGDGHAPIDSYGRDASEAYGGDEWLRRAPYRQVEPPSVESWPRPSHQPEPRRCGRCGAHLGPDDEFCPQCGTRAIYRPR